MAPLSAVAVTLLGAGALATKPADDDAGERDALYKFGAAMNYKKWAAKDGWLDDSLSICKWNGVSCTNGRVTKIHMPDNGLDGTLPVELSALTELTDLKLNSARTDDYHGCGANNFHNSTLEPLFGLKKLTSINLEYNCLGGGLDGIEGMTALESLQIHGNYLSGTIPAAMAKLTNLQVMKLGRNPLTGTVPAFTTLNKLTTFNCNFCALSGQFPDIFGHMPLLEQSFWDGNGLTGTIPSSIGKAPNLAKLSFNINSLTGPIPDGICDTAAGKGADCRIGADTDIDIYQGNYPWILLVKGNLFDCSGGVPKCVKEGAACNKTKSSEGENNPGSPVLCAPKATVLV